NEVAALHDTVWLVSRCEILHDCAADYLDQTIGATVTLVANNKVRCARCGLAAYILECSGCCLQADACCCKDGCLQAVLRRRNWRFWNAQLPVIETCHKIAVACDNS